MAAAKAHFRSLVVRSILCFKPQPDSVSYSLRAALSKSAGPITLIEILANWQSPTRHKIAAAAKAHFRSIVVHSILCFRLQPDGVSYSHHAVLSKSAGPIT